MDGRHASVWVVAGMAGAAQAGGGIIHVDDTAPPGGDGASWATPYRSLQTAIFDAVSNGGVEIRVAQGVYTPGEPGERNASFPLFDGVTLKGGYAGFDMPEPNLRSITEYETVLSGDLLGDDGPNFANYEDNSFSVVTAGQGDATAVLDGFTVRGGNGDFGGGLNIGPGGPTIRWCTIEANVAATRGGGAYVDGGSPTFEHCTFRTNRGDIGGGMQVRGAAASVIARETCFENNDAFAGGGMIQFDGELTLIGCEFNAHTVFDSGAGLIIGEATASVIDTTFRQGVAGWHSGAAAVVGPTEFVNCVISRNTSSLGGGMYFSATGDLHNCTFSGNEPGGLIVDENGTPMLYNAILWGNTPFQIGHDPAFDWTPPSVHFGVVQGGWDSGQGVIDEDPLFVQPGSDDVRLSIGSPAVDAGNAAALPPDTHDLDGDGDTTEPLPLDHGGSSRVQGDEVDLGAFEGEHEGQPIAATADGIDPGDFAALVVGGGLLNPLESPVLIITNNSPVVGSVWLTQLDHDVHPDAGGYTEINMVLDVASNIPEGQFLGRLFLPFDAGDIGEAVPAHVNMTTFDASADAWTLGVADNVTTSPNGFGPIGTRIVNVDGGPWSTSNAMGDYGVYWDPGQGKGFVWAIVDHLGEFAIGAAVCPADCHQTPDGVVSTIDFLTLLGAWAQPATGSPCDLDFDGVVGQPDLLELLSAWGGCGSGDGVSAPPRPMPRSPDIDGNTVIDSGDLDVLRATWGVCSGCITDLDGDDRVGLSDYVKVLRAWGD